MEVSQTKARILLDTSYVIYHSTSGVFRHSFVPPYIIASVIFLTMVFAKSRWCLTRIETNRISVRNEFSNRFQVPAWLMSLTLAEWKTPFTIRLSIDECRGKSIHTQTYVYIYSMHTVTFDVYHPANTWLPYTIQRTRSKQLCILTANTQSII